MGGLVVSAVRRQALSRSSPAGDREGSGANGQPNTGSWLSSGWPVSDRRNLGLGYRLDVRKADGRESVSDVEI